MDIILKDKLKPKKTKSLPYCFGTILVLAFFLMHAWLAPPPVRQQAVQAFPAKSADNSEVNAPRPGMESEFDEEPATDPFLWGRVRAGIEAAGLAGSPLIFAIQIMFGIATILIIGVAVGRLGFPDNMTVLLARILLAASAPFAIWCKGLEPTLPLAFLLTAGSIQLLGETEKKRLPISSGLLYGLAVLLHPPAILFLLPAIAALAGLFTTDAASPARTDPSPLLRIGVLIAPPVLLLTAWSALHTPEALQALASFVSFNPPRGVSTLFHFLLIINPLVLPLLLFSLLRTPARPARITLWLQFALYLVYVMISGGDGAPFSRMLVILLPWFALLVAEQLHTLYRAVRNIPALSPSALRWVSVGTVLCLVAVSLLPGIL